MLKNEVQIRLLILVGLIALITALHYLTGTDKAHIHDIYRRLYYIPIILGGLWFMLKGGMATAIAISIIFAPHVLFQWGHHPGSEPEQYLEILIYNVIGFITGFLAQRERVQKDRYQQAAQRLEESYVKLREQADQILEIEDQLRRADRLSALGELSAELAHEIRNPLGSISGTAEILQDGIDPSDRRYEFARILLKEVARLNSVVENFLQFARPSRSERGAFTPAEVLGDVLTLVERQAQKCGVRLVHEVGPEEVLGDRDQIKQAFLNLVLNAVQAMSGGGTLRIQGRREGDSLCLLFQDNGPGIAVDNLERIFSPFFTTRAEGVGLGLAITQRIVRRNGGEISVESRPGKGTTFRLCLPLADAAKNP
ncbi:two-component system sensor histidine kinase NtrB [Geoalkalibacter halelectricus]|uniref:histidine kinase n=1 Tax=Geoalkalibacter halelectricus TaxID=2847045 RepID=A0ABY5ZIP1_9BACT|nr:ATP-binding protein [Geoalkalibacter halelectricus]MDO3379603.1 ATP-binding protein [Geoalkalibacter halelectricus]UWZ78581.1 ATP-binding protein [Geoalkalibacter halelectricus]